MNANSTDVPAKPRRRWLRFSLRTFFIVITLLCIWLGFKVNAAHRQHEAVEAILRVGGEVTFDYQLVSVPNSPDEFTTNLNASPPGPAWLRNLIGDEYFREVVEITIEDRAIAESDFAQLAKVPYLRRIGLGSTPIILDEHNFRPPVKASESEPWDDFHRPISNGFSDNRSGNGFTSGVAVRPIRDADLVVLQNLSQLRAVVLIDNDITGSGLASLVGLKHLREFRIFSFKLDDSAAEEIGEMTNLRELSVGGTRLADKSLRLMRLQDKPDPEHLLLDGGPFSDDGLAKLKVLTKLKSLYLEGGHLTPDQLKELQQAMPSTGISQ